MDQKHSFSMDTYKSISGTSGDAVEGANTQSTNGVHEREVAGVSRGTRSR